jgi:hypothetical protein
MALSKIIKTNIDPQYRTHLEALVRSFPGMTDDDFNITYYDVKVPHGRLHKLAIMIDPDNQCWTFAMMHIDNIDDGFNRMIRRTMFY